ncbi:MAG: 16S rRNA (cytosine(967)-C(5))-methyltransferase RsmB [Oscillospiraceae bacterium]|nr:MAG: 16S rRNA (cytosine(967)-C(5))-methyltransferase RsmB [Oscillospiraceae bacterium]
MYNVDYIISCFARGKLKPVIQDILRLSVYQLIYMNVPDYTVCDEAVLLTVRTGKQALKGYVNGVLRNIARNKENIVYPDAQKEPEKYLSVKYSWPIFLVREAIKDLGFTKAEAALSYNAVPMNSVKANPLLCGDERLFELLKEKGAEPRRGTLQSDVIYIKGNAALGEKLFENGFYSVQSEPSAMVCRAVDPQPGESILDCCAAPGGKTVCMAEIIGNGSITACEYHKHRCDLIFANAQRCKVRDKVKIINADMTQPQKELGLYDRVLVDAPCSGLGVVGSKPDVKLTLTPEKLKEIRQVQKKILDNCCNYVKPGGVLVYSTCTIRPEENSKQVNSFLSKHPEFTIDNINAPEAVKTREGFIQLLPWRDGVYGFFIARMRRADI